MPALIANLYVSLLTLRYGEKCWFFRYGISRSKFFPRLKALSLAMKDEGITPAEWLQFRFDQYEFIQKKKGNEIVKGPALHFILLPEVSFRKLASWCHRETHGRFRTPLLLADASRILQSHWNNISSVYSELTTYELDEITEDLVRKLLVKHKVPSTEAMERAVKSEAEAAKEQLAYLTERRDAGEWIWR
jgi:hypothetical protein